MDRNKLLKKIAIITTPFAKSLSVILFIHAIVGLIPFMSIKKPKNAKI